MGTHAKRRTRVRTVALGTLAVGATLTGVGLTAAALDPAGANLADGTLTGDPVDPAASGLGAPVPVAAVSTPDGGSPGTTTLAGGTAPALGVGAVSHGVPPGSTTMAVRPGLTQPEPTWPRGGTVGGVPEHLTPQGAGTNAPSSTPPLLTTPSLAAPPFITTANSGSANSLTSTAVLPTGVLPLGPTVAGLLDAVAGLI